MYRLMDSCWQEYLWIAIKYVYGIIDVLSSSIVLKLLMLMGLLMSSN